MDFSNLLKELENAKEFFSEEDYETINKLIQKTREKTKTNEPRVNKAEEHKNEGNAFFKNQQYSEAVLSYSQAIEEDGNNPVYYSNRAAAYANLKLKDSGIDDCKKAIEIDPKFVKAYVRLGDFYFEDDIESAKKYYKEGLKIEPGNELLKNKIKLCEDKKTKKDVNFDDTNVADMLKNPEILNMAKNLMKDKSPEEIEAMMKEVLSGMKK